MTTKTRAGNFFEDFSVGQVFHHAVPRTELTAPPTITAVNSVSGTACPRCIVDVYSDQEGEGGTYEGTTAADADGRFAFQGIPSGRYVTATVTDAEGSTSLFSQPFPMPGG